jgi:hypothetical protein
MPTYRTVDALALVPGDMVIVAVPTGHVERVCVGSELGEASTVVVHTDERDIAVGWPWQVRVVSG